MPTEFHWIIPKLLAGSAQPGLLEPLEDDLTFLVGLGATVLVTLTEVGPAPAWSAVGLEAVHFPIADMGIPTPRAAEGLCAALATMMASGRPVVVHCRAGLGRTGTVLAALLIYLGRTPAQALAEVRQQCRNYVQSDVQHAFLDHFAAHLQSQTTGADTVGGAMLARGDR